jgi:hypothetical protein
LSLELQEKDTFSKKKNMSLHGDKLSEQLFTYLIFSEDFVRIGDSVRTTFLSDIKIAGKCDYFKFCKPHISSKFYLAREIFYIQILVGVLYKLTKFEGMLGREYLLKMSKV